MPIHGSKLRWWTTCVEPACSRWERPASVGPLSSTCLYSQGRLVSKNTSSAATGFQSSDRRFCLSWPTSAASLCWSRRLALDADGSAVIASSQAPPQHRSQHRPTSPLLQPRWSPVDLLLTWTSSDTLFGWPARCRSHDPSMSHLAIVDPSLAWASNLAHTKKTICHPTNRGHLQHNLLAFCGLPLPWLELVVEDVWLHSEQPACKSDPKTSSKPQMPEKHLKHREVELHLKGLHGSILAMLLFSHHAHHHFFLGTCL